MCVRYQLSDLGMVPENTTALQERNINGTRANRFSILMVDFHPLSIQCLYYIAF